MVGGVAQLHTHTRVLPLCKFEKNLQKRSYFPIDPFGCEVLVKVAATHNLLLHVSNYVRY